MAPGCSGSCREAIEHYFADVGGLGYEIRKPKTIPRKPKTIPRKPKTIPVAPGIVMHFDGHDCFIIVDGVKIAKRGHPNTPEARTWISLDLKSAASAARAD